jgi:hypothetical protein
MNLLQKSGKFNQRPSQLIMIVSKLTGGLGNQMFQYACGRSVAARFGASLALDAANVASSTPAAPRRYSLDVFNIAAPVIAPEELALLMNPPALSFAAQLWTRLRRGRSTPVILRRIVESQFHFDPSFLAAAGDNVYLDGYWQSEKYFQDQAELIRQDFTLVSKLEASLRRDLFKQVEQCESVSVHIRRGDYAAHAETNQFHGLCSPEYYQRSSEYLAAQVENPVFFLFSDDPDWVQENLHLSHPTIQVSNGLLQDYEELCLMSRCRHHIIANSSFSWWGAWLNPRSNKIVCAPKRWFADESINTSDLIPEGWLRL